MTPLPLSGRARSVSGGADHTRHLLRLRDANSRPVCDADAAIINPQPGDTILGGAQNGAEMGAFCLERIALKRRGLALKYQEFMPINLTPVWIDAD